MLPAVTRESPKHSKSMHINISPPRIRRRPRTIVYVVVGALLVYLVFFRGRSSERNVERTHDSEAPTTPRRSPNDAIELQRSRRPKHRYRSNGLLDINLEASHPVFELAARAEQQWNAKHDSQSKTLQEAVAEYERRYGRKPPKGFDLWWEYVMKNDVKLPDEYDLIYRNIEPYWGIDPMQLRRLQQQLEGSTQTLTIVNEGGVVSIVEPEIMDADMAYVLRTRGQPQLDMLKEVQEMISDFRATFNIGKTPTQFMSYELRELAIDAARKGQALTPSGVSQHKSIVGWAAGCPADSPLRKQPRPQPPNLKKAWSTTQKTFIHDHAKTFDICQNPSYLSLNGFLQGSPSPETNNTFAPIFSSCGTSLHSDILAIPPYESTRNGNWGPSWSQKKTRKAYWRGTTEGALYTESNPLWNTTHKVRLAEVANDKGDEIYVLPGGENRHSAVGHGERVELNWMNEEWMDIKFVRKPMGCDAGVCRELERRFEFKTKWEDDEKVKDWKFMIDIDDTTCSPKFRKLLQTKSLVFKATIHQEWWSDRIQPWLHYVPLKVDYTDLYDLMAFFVGDIHGSSKGHEEMASVIGAQGRKWANSFWRQEDMVAYTFRLFLEYARVMSPERDSMYFDL